MWWPSASWRHCPAFVRDIRPSNVAKSVATRDLGTCLFLFGRDFVFDCPESVRPAINLAHAELGARARTLLRCHGPKDGRFCQHREHTLWSCLCICPDSGGHTLRKREHRYLGLATRQARLAGATLRCTPALPTKPYLYPCRDGRSRSLHLPGCQSDTNHEPSWLPRSSAVPAGRCRYDSCVALSSQFSRLHVSFGALPGCLVVDSRIACAETPANQFLSIVCFSVESSPIDSSSTGPPDLSTVVIASSAEY